METDSAGDLPLPDIKTEEISIDWNQGDNELINLGEDSQSTLEDSSSE